MLVIDEFQLDLITVTFSYFNIVAALAWTWNKPISHKMKNMLLIFSIAEPEWNTKLQTILSASQKVSTVIIPSCLKRGRV